MLAHYGFVALPCRVADPDRKGKVERGVRHAKNTPLKDLRFESLEEAQAYLDNWEAKWADTRIHGTTKRQVAAIFGEEKPFAVATTAGTVPPVLVWQTARKPEWLRRGRCRLPQCAARLDRQQRESAAGRPPGASDGSG